MHRLTDLTIFADRHARMNHAVAADLDSVVNSYVWIYPYASFDNAILPDDDICLDLSCFVDATPMGR